VDDGGALAVRIVGSVLVRNEDVFVERAIRNAAAFCDRIYAFDHMSRDRTWEILRDLSRELEHLEVHRSRRTRDSHRPLERLAGTSAWVLGIDGDELFDPAALATLREQLLAGAYADVFRLKAHVLNCDELDDEAGNAMGYMAPPSRPVTKLFNLAALDSWPGASERLHDGTPVFRPGQGWDSMRYLSDSLSWEEDPLRCIHVCFLRRSSLDQPGSSVRQNVNETGAWDRSPLGALKRRVRPRRLPAQLAELRRAGGDWKRDWYARGDRVTVDATPFLGRSVQASAKR
jgi:hypothetical protein